MQQSRYVIVCPQCGQGRTVNAAAPKPVHEDQPCPLAERMAEANIALVNAQADAVRMGKPVPPRSLRPDNEAIF